MNQASHSNANGAQTPSGPRPGPNYFLSVRVSHSQAVVRTVKQVQGHMLEKKPELKKTMDDVVNGHITLFVLALRDEEVEAAKAALKSAGASKAFPLRLGGLRSFRDEVLYLGLKEGTDAAPLFALQARLKGHYVKAGFMDALNVDCKDFIPHVTIAKIRKGGPTLIDPSAYSEMTEVEVAEDVRITEVHLCRMRGKKPGKYYPIEQQLHLAK